MKGCSVVPLDVAEQYGALQSHPAYRGMIQVRDALHLVDGGSLASDLMLPFESVKRTGLRQRRVDRSELRREGVIARQVPA